MSYGLGRRPEFDEKSRNHPIRALIAPTAKPKTTFWKNHVVLNQGTEGSCVGFAWAAEAASDPMPIPGITNHVAFQIYRRAQQLDIYPDTESGSSVIAGAKACVERGWYKGYKWAFGMDDVLLALSYAGPVVFGLNWYSGMRSTDRHGFIHADGNLDGGHCIEAGGLNMEEEFIELQNSWSDTWGVRGRCKLGFKDLEQLLHEAGECCVPVGRAMVAQVKRRPWWRFW